MKLLKHTSSLCPDCRISLPARVVHDNGAVKLLKHCADHGEFAVTLARDADHYALSRGTASEGSSDPCCEPGSSCCPDTKNPFEVLSTCIALIEIVDSCNLPCPTCFASSPLIAKGQDVAALGFNEFVDRVESVIERKGEIEILQLSGGEPTLHPRFFELLEWSLAHRKIGYVLINTNAVRIAREEEFLQRLAASHRQYGKFELYVQFDGPQNEGQQELRGMDLRKIRQTAIDTAGEVGIPSTLAMVVTEANLRALGDTLRFALDRPHCRGITFQPIFTSGRVPATQTVAGTTHHEPITAGDIVSSLVEQSLGLLASSDFTPLPCGDPNCHTLGYLLRTPNGPVGLGQFVDLSKLQGFLSDRVNYDLADLIACGCDNEPLGQLMHATELGPDQPLRIFIKPFMDAWTWDQDRIDRCCTHVIRPDGQLDSFCRYYLSGGAQSTRS